MMQGYGYGPPPSMRQETALFAAGGVQVTTARFVCWQQTYPMGGITSVSPFTIQAARTGPYALAVFSAFWAIVWFASLVWDPNAPAVLMLLVSAGLVAAGIMWGRSRKATHGVMITTAGMNVRAVASPDGVFVQQIVGALNQALSMR